MKLIFYNRPGGNAKIRPASSRRTWMDETFESFAYRCLPITMANAYGWEILSPASFMAVWDGTEGQSALSRMRWLFVIARNSSFTYKGRAVDVKQVGRELGVRCVLEGSVRKAGNRVIRPH